MATTFLDNADKVALEALIKKNASAIAEEIIARQAEIAIERARINEIASLPEGSTTGDAELADIRVAANGKRYTSAGEAVRAQFSTVNGAIKVLQFGNINNTGIELGSFKVTGEEVVSTTVSRCDDYIPVIAGDTIYAIFENTTVKYISCFFYDINKTLISTSNLYGKNMTTSTSLVTELTVPENAAYMRFNHSVASVDYKVGIYYSYYNATTVEEYVEPVIYVNADKMVKNGQTINLDDFATLFDIEVGDESIKKRLTADAESIPKTHIIPEYEYGIAMVDAVRKQMDDLWGIANKLSPRTILDSGVCGENLTWALYSDGLLKISGTGRSYDYCKGVLIGKTREEIEAAVAAGSIPAEYAFQEGKTYDDTNGQYVAPWYKYRDEVDFTSYTTEAKYNEENPRGWKYNRIEIDEGITYLGDWLFYRVSGPTELIIPESVTELGDWAIRYSPTLKCIYLPDGITTVGYRGCSRNEVATAIRLGSGLTTAGDYAFAQNSMVKYLNVQGSADTTFGEYLCNGNRALEYISFSNVSEIGETACVLCSSLAKVDLPDSLRAIRYGAFLNLKTLTSIKIPSLVTTIETNAFYGCTGLKSVYIDSQTIANNLNNYHNCGNLITNAKYIYIKNDIEKIGTYVTANFTKAAEIDGYVLYILNEE